jgi:hypothetical protein
LYLSIYNLVKKKKNQLLVVSVVIDAELGRDDHGLIATVIGRRMKPLDARTDPRIRLN